MTEFKRVGMRMPMITQVIVTLKSGGEPVEMTLRDVSTHGVFLEKPQMEGLIDLKAGDLVYIKVQDIDDAMPREMKVVRESSDGWGLEFVV